MTDRHESMDLAETFAEIARSLLSEHSLDATLAKIVESAVHTIDGCEYAAISLIERRQITTRAASDPVAKQVDAIQYEADQGPCLDAIRDHEVFEVGDLATDERWPAFSHRAASETGVLSMIAFRLFVEEDTMGALNLFARAPHAFDDEARAIGSVFAAHAAVAMSTARQIGNLEALTESRPSIDQAKGIIMATVGCSAEEAFELLRQQSQALNVKLRTVADELIERQRRA